MKPYRANVGICLFNGRGEVFCGRSWSDGPEIVAPGSEWQMPQGGIDPNEDIVVAAKRELQEETGISQADVLSVTDEWWTYDFPPYDGPPHRLAGFNGQRQKWVAMRYHGDETEIDIGNPNGEDPPEFLDWRWMALPDLLDNVVAYKQPIYRNVINAFGHLSGSRP